ncbi:MAG TPA: carboxypeptidase-like regulatory domain-containing protein, partial [Candidatus Baltobacteraceae bacterium]|nr:carboxypeptidase-like regulatory domain-containing protein [Candidatus Baltobacteraceae bacterium]
MLAALASSGPARAQETPSTAAVSGTLVYQTNGLPVSGAEVTLYQGTAVVATTHSNGDGLYTFSGVAPGIYSIEIRAQGFRPTRIDTVALTAGSTTTIRTPLLRADSGTGGNLREIATVQSSLKGNTLASSATIQQNLSPAQLQSTGFLKAADALGQIPSINLSGSP